MGLVLVCSEDNKYRTYKSKGKLYHWLFHVIGLVLAALSGTYFRLRNYPLAITFLLVLLILIFFVFKDMVPLKDKRNLALKDGKIHMEKGSIIKGDYELKIKK